MFLFPTVSKPLLTTKSRFQLIPNGIVMAQLNGHWVFNWTVYTNCAVHTKRTLRARSCSVVVAQMLECMQLNLQIQELIPGNSFSILAILVLAY